MNDQIDSSIPTLTEVIAPATATPAVNENRPPLAKPAQATASTTSVRAPTSDIRPISSGGSLPMHAVANSIVSSKVMAAPPTAKPTINAGGDNKATQQANVPTIDKQDMSDEEFQLLEQTVRENVLRQVLSRVDFVLEHRVRDSLAEVLQNAVDQLADDIRAGLRQSLEEVVTRAVTQELTKLKSHKS